MNRAIIIVSGVAFILAASGSAFSAGRAPPPPPAYSWTGFYLGGNVGYGWGDASTEIAGSGTSLSFFNFPTTNPITFASDSATQRLQGVIGGGQIGYNYQISPQWVLGFETDIQASGERGSNTFTTPLSGEILGAAFPIPFSGPAVTSYEAKIEWFGTVRGRVGYLLNDGLLLYGTGGLAYGQVNGSGNLNAIAFAPTFGGAAAFQPITSTFDHSKTNIGFAVGTGLEGRLAPWLSPNWTWKLEYLYVDLGSLDTSIPFAAESNFVGVTPVTGSMTTHTHFTDNIVRVGLNYQFH